MELYNEEILDLFDPSTSKGIFFCNILNLFNNYFKLYQPRVKKRNLHFFIIYEIGRQWRVSFLYFCVNFGTKNFALYSTLIPLKDNSKFVELLNCQISTLLITYESFVINLILLILTCVLNIIVLISYLLTLKIIWLWYDYYYFSSKEIWNTNTWRFYWSHLYNRNHS